MTDKLQQEIAEHYQKAEQFKNAYKSELRKAKIKEIGLKKIQKQFDGIEEDLKKIGDGTNGNS